MKTVKELLNISYKARAKRLGKEVKKIRKEIEKSAKNGMLNMIWRNDYFDKKEVSIITNTLESIGFEVETIADLYCIKWG